MFAYRGFAITAFILGLIALLACTAGPWFIQQKIHQSVLDQIIWQPDSPQETYDRHATMDRPQDPVDLVRTWFFNLTNVDEVKAGGKPVLKEIGPYVYQKHRRKQEIWFNEEGLVKFKMYDFSIYRPDLSVSDAMTDNIVTANIPLLGALEKARQVSPQLMTLLAGYVRTFADEHNNGIFMHRTPNEMLWGYEDPLASALKKLVPTLQSRYGLMKNDTSLEAALAKEYDVFNTGVHDLSLINQQILWGGVPAVTSWNNHTEMVKGTDASQFIPGLNVNSSVDVFVPELYRSARLVVGEVVQNEGITNLRFVPDPVLSEPDPRYFQFIKGLMNITTPQAAGPTGSPNEVGPLLYLAYPHFCDADPFLADNVSGLQCDPEKHTLYLDVEPVTGITMGAAKRLMLVTEYGPQYDVLEPSVLRTFLPVFWAEEVAGITPQAAADFRKGLYGAQKLQRQLRMFGFLATLALMLTALLLTVLGCFAVGLHPRLRTHSRTASHAEDGAQPCSAVVTAPAVSPAPPADSRENGLSQPLLMNDQGSESA